jgi:hypothetical protein
MRKSLSVLILCMSIFAVGASSASAQNNPTDNAYLGVGGEQQGNLPPANTPGQGGGGQGDGGQGDGGDIAGDEQGDGLGSPSVRTVPLQDGNSLPNPNTVDVADKGSNQSGADLPFTGLQLALLALAAVALMSAGLAVRWMAPGRPV